LAGGKKPAEGEGPQKAYKVEGSSGRNNVAVKIWGGVTKKIETGVNNWKITRISLRKGEGREEQL